MKTEKQWSEEYEGCYEDPSCHEILVREVREELRAEILKEIGAMPITSKFSEVGNSYRRGIAHACDVIRCCGRSPDEKS